MTRKKEKYSKGKKLTSAQLKDAILKLFQKHSKSRMNPRQISRKLNVANNKDSIAHALEQLAEEGNLIRLENYKYKLRRTPAANLSKTNLTGRVDMTRSGAAYIVCEGLDNDIYVNAKHLNSALNGDTVEVSVWKRRGGRRQEGEVVRILKRKATHFIGTVQLHDKFAFVVPDQFSMPIDIYVDIEDIKGAQDGEKVVVRIEKWHGGKHRNPVGVITSVLGKAGSSDIEMKSILINNGFNLDFPDAVLKEAEQLTDEITPEELEARRDMRGVPTFTIDPEDAKDFDDALSMRFLKNGNCEIGVHIADVAHYVKPGSKLDKEALDRSTSVYLVDRVLPMLPERLSNGLCSLRPDEDKFTFSAVFEFDKDDQIVSRWFGRTLTHSNRRFTYNEAQEVIESGEGDFVNELRYINRLAKKLRTRRFKEGSIDFDVEEVRFRLDETGAPIDVYIKERKDAHLLIEDFMLLANREVAAYMYNKGKGQEIPFVYRVHDEPDPDRVAELAAFARELGFKMDVSSPQAIARSYNSLTKAAQENSGLKLLEPLAIRTMAKAEYTSDNIGHYGLGFDFYTHFTSPIRRYSDVLVHRILYENIDARTERMNKHKLEEMCKHISTQERRAMDAERQSIKYKQAEFLEQHVGEVFEGYVSGIIDRGIFVELAVSKAEGMVGFDTLSEPFEIESSRLRARGLHTRKEIRMGDKLKVRVKSVNLTRREVDMELIED
jgi:ribonuclease R